MIIKCVFSHIYRVIRFDPNFFLPLQCGRLSIIVWWGYTANQCCQGSGTSGNGPFLKYSRRKNYRVCGFWATFNSIYRQIQIKKILLLMCIILGMYTWQLKNGEAVVTQQTTWVSARAYMLRLLHSRNKHDSSHYRLYKIINTRLR